jgi:hypothetical protein
MTLKLYKNLSDKNVVSKNITQLGSDITGTLREDCSIIDPVITIQSVTGFSLQNCNYAYISEFGRYYYINNIVCTGKLFELHMHVDVLKTYASEIRSNTAVISRQENKYNLYLQDGVFKTYANPNFEITQFPSGFTSDHFVLAVAGG